MHLSQITLRFLKYNLWANTRLTAWLLTLDRNLLYKHTASSFGNLDRILQHMLAAETYWYDIIVHEKIQEFNLPEREHDAEAVIADLITSSHKLVATFSAFSEQQLAKQIQASDSRQSRYEYILHVVNHASYHRGQIVTLCRALNVTGDIPVTDYDAYLWWIENESH